MNRVSVASTVYARQGAVEFEAQLEGFERAAASRSAAAVVAAARPLGVHASKVRLLGGVCAF